MATLAILCGTDTYTGMHTFSELHINELRKYLNLPNGIPSHDVFGDVLSQADIGVLNQCFRIFTDSLREGELKDRVAALDGKTIRRNQNSEHSAYHIEIVYLSDMQLVLGYAVVEKKTNELSAIPTLLKMLSLKT